MNDCIFCKIASGSIPSRKVADTEELYAFEDTNPQAPTHILIIPKRHIESTLSLKKEDAELVGRITILAAEIAVSKGLDRTGFRLLTNTGRNAGQSVFHLHYHLLGGRLMAWPPG
jgi:histidine triad (HIT) family protein